MIAIDLRYNPPSRTLWSPGGRETREGKCRFDHRHVDLGGAPVTYAGARSVPPFLKVGEIMPEERSPLEQIIFLARCLRDQVKRVSNAAAHARQWKHGDSPSASTSERSHFLSWCRVLDLAEQNRADLVDLQYQHLPSLWPTNLRKARFTWDMASLSAAEIETLTSEIDQIEHLANQKNAERHSMGTSAKDSKSTNSHVSPKEGSREDLVLIAMRELDALTESKRQSKSSIVKKAFGNMADPQSHKDLFRQLVKQGKIRSAGGGRGGGYFLP